MSKQTTLKKSQKIEEEEEFDEIDEEEIEIDDEESEELDRVNSAVKLMITSFYHPNLKQDQTKLKLSQDCNMGVEPLKSKSYLSERPRKKILKISSIHLLQLLSALDVYQNTESIEDYLIFSICENKNNPEYPLLVIEDKENRGYIVPRID